jgi:hypothetical protein
VLLTFLKHCVSRNLRWWTVSKIMVIVPSIRVLPSEFTTHVLIQVQFQNTCKCVCPCRLQVTSSVFSQYCVCWSQYCDTCFPLVCFAEWLAHMRTERRLAGNSNLREQVMPRVQMHLSYLEHCEVHGLLGDVMQLSHKQRDTILPFLNWFCQFFILQN